VEVEFEEGENLWLFKASQKISENAELFFNFGCQNALNYLRNFGYIPEKERSCGRSGYLGLDIFLIYFLFLISC
jgi:hypothetical protein